MIPFGKVFVYFIRYNYNTLIIIILLFHLICNLFFIGYEKTYGFYGEKLCSLSHNITPSSGFSCNSPLRILSVKFWFDEEIYVGAFLKRPPPLPKT